MTYEEFLKDTIEMHRRKAPFFAGFRLDGERRAVKREGKEPVDVLWYYPKNKPAGRLPVIVNAHGGGFTACDAVQTGSLCRFLSDELGALALNVNYKKAPEAPFPYAIDEICDVIRYLIENAAALGVDPDRIAVSGESAGASLAAAVAMKLANETNIRLACQVLVYPCTDLTNDFLPEPAPYDEWIDYCHRCYLGETDRHHPYVCHLAAERDMLEKTCPAVILTCEHDTLRLQGELYADRLKDAFVPVTIRRFKGAVHGFVEVNRPDWGEPDERITPEQDALAREAERYIVEQLRILL